MTCIVCQSPHPTVLCVECGRDTTHYRITALDGRPRCQRCHVDAWRRRTRTARR